MAPNSEAPTRSPTGGLLGGVAFPDPSFAPAEKLKRKARVASWGARGSAKHIGAGASDASRRRAAAIMLLIRVPLAASASDRGVGVAQCVSMIEFLRGRSSGSGQGVFVLWSGNLLISTDVGIGRGLSDADSRAPGA